MAYLPNLIGSPTLSQWRASFRDGSPSYVPTENEIALAARDRGVPVKDGRIGAEHAADVYFGVLVRYTDYEPSR